MSKPARIAILAAAVLLVLGGGALTYWKTRGLSPGGGSERTMTVASPTGGAPIKVALPGGAAGMALDLADMGNKSPEEQAAMFKKMMVESQKEMARNYRAMTPAERKKFVDEMVKNEVEAKKSGRMMSPATRPGDSTPGVRVERTVIGRTNGGAPTTQSMSIRLPAPDPKEMVATMTQELDPETQAALAQMQAELKAARKRAGLPERDGMILMFKAEHTQTVPKP